MYIHFLFQSGRSFILHPSLSPLYPQAVAVGPLNLKILAFEGFNFTAISLIDPQYQYTWPFITKSTLLLCTAKSKLIAYLLYIVSSNVKFGTLGYDFTFKDVQGFVCACSQYCLPAVCEAT